MSKASEGFTRDELIEGGADPADFDTPPWEDDEREPTILSEWDAPRDYFSLLPHEKDNR